MNTFVEVTRYEDGKRVLVNLNAVTHVVEEGDYGLDGHRKARTRLYLASGEDFLIDGGYKRFVEIVEQTLRVPASPAMAGVREAFPGAEAKNDDCIAEDSDENSTAWNQSVFGHE